MKILVDVAAPVFGQVIPSVPLHVHDADKCEGYPCPFHGPSAHHMVDWPMIVRLDKSALVERTCPHGTGHPDPDSLAYYQRLAELGTNYVSGEPFTAADAAALGVHGCDGCCKVPE